MAQEAEVSSKVSKSDEKFKNLLILIVVGMLGFSTILSLAILASSDIDTDNIKDLFDKDPTAYKDKEVDTGFGVDKDGDKMYDIVPENLVAPSIIVTKLSMNSLLTKNQRLASKIFALHSGDEIVETVEFEVINGNVNKEVVFEFSLIEGVMDKGLLKHDTTDRVAFQSKKVYDRLDKGKYTLKLTGRVPPNRPSHDWHLGIVEVSGAVKAGVVNWRDDDKTKPKWTVAIANDEFKTEKNKIFARLEGDKLKIDFEQNRPIIGYTPLLLVGVHVKVEVLSYPGKGIVVYDRTPILEGNTLDILISKLGTNPNCGPNECYLKIRYGDVDLNPSTESTAAYVNIPYTIQGGTAWSQRDEFFQMFRPFAMFQMFGEPITP